LQLLNKILCAQQVARSVKNSRARYEFVSRFRGTQRCRPSPCFARHHKIPPTESGAGKAVIDHWFCRSKQAGSKEMLLRSLGIAILHRH